MQDYYMKENRSLRNAHRENPGKLPGRNSRIHT